MSGTRLNIPGGMRAVIETITPAKAAKLLDCRYDDERKLREGIVRKYAADMVAGGWHLNGEAIKIDCDGRLVDGQHRLHACILADVPFSTLIVTGTEIEARMTMDVGESRALSHQLTLRGVRDSRQVTTLLRHLFAWEEGRPLGSSASRPVTVREALGIRQRWPTADAARMLAIVATTRGKGAGINRTNLSLFLTLALIADPERASEFAARLGDGVNLGAAHPILTLRNHIAQRAMRGERDSRTQRIAWMLQAWEACKAGRLRKVYRKTDAIASFPGVEGRTSQRSEE